MGFDINGFKKAFIEKVEKMVNGENSEFNNGKIDPHEKSIFTQELNKAVQNGEITEADAKAIFGLEISGANSSNAGKTSGVSNTNEVDEMAQVRGARRAPSDGNGNPVVNITVEDGGVCNIMIDNSSNWQLTINITADLKNMVKELIDAFKNGFESINENNNALFAELKQYLTDQNELTSHIFSFLYTLYDTIRMDGDLQIDALMAILNAINENGEQIGFKIDQTNELLKALNEMLMDKLDNIAIMISKADANAQQNMETLINLVKTNNEEQDKQNNILSNVLNAIKSLNGTIKTFSNDQRQQLAAILNLLQAQGDQLDANFEKVLAMLESIRLAQGDNNEVLGDIYTAIKEGNNSLLNALSLINQNFSKYGDDIKAQLMIIAQKEFTANVELNIDIDAIMAKLEQIIARLTSIDENTEATAENTEATAYYTKQILDAISKLGFDVTNKLDAILEAIDNDTTKMDQLIALLNKMDANNTEQNIAILDAINNLGVHMTAGFTNLIEIGNENNELQEQTNAMLYHVIDLISNLKLECPNVVIDMSAVINAINKNGDNINQQISDLNALINTLNQNVVNGNKEMAAKIIEAIKNLGIEMTAGFNNLIEIGNTNNELQEQTNNLLNKVIELVSNLKLECPNVVIDMSAVIASIDKNGANVSQQLTDLYNLIATLNKNVVDGNNNNKQMGADIIAAIKALGLDVVSGFSNLVEIGNTNNELQTKTNELIQNLANLVKNLQIPGGGGDITINLDVDAIVNAIKNAGGDMGAKMDEIIALLNTINSNVVEGNEQDKKLAQDIINAINKLGFDIAGDIATIIAKMDGDTAKMEELLAFLKTMDANNETRNKAILDAIATLGVNVMGGINNLIQIGETNNELQTKTNELIEKLTTVVKNLQITGGGGDVNITIDVDAIVNAIKNAGGDMGAKMDEILALLNTINSNVVEGNEQDKELAKQIIDAINALGFNIAGNLTTIITKMDGDTAKMEELLTFLKTMDANNETRNKAILDAIAALGVDVLEALNNLDVKVTVEGGGSGGPTDLTEVINIIDQVGANLDETLQAILTMMKTLNGQVIEGNTTNQNFAQLILNAITNVGNIIDGGGQTLDLSAIIDILNQILEAIKNHEVIITINSDGTVNCDGGTVHEGEVDDWNNVLGARAANFGDETGISNTENKENVLGSVTVNGKTFKPGKYTGQALGLATGVYIVKDGKIFDVGGKEVRPR